MSHNKIDKIYAKPKEKVEKFRFDETVAAVFPDMLRRSIPGYELIQEMTGILATRYAQADSNLYDLGCSLGASSISMLKNIEAENCTLIAIDNSDAMIEGARKNIEALFPEKKDWQLVCDDIKNIAFSNASIINLNFTLQFIEPAQRQALINNIYQGLKPGGILILSEKIAFDEQAHDELLTELHHAFKKANGYSELEISQKRSALENVLIRDSKTEHLERLAAAGFTTSATWFQCFNFISLLAVKSF